MTEKRTKFRRIVVDLYELMSFFFFLSVVRSLNIFSRVVFIDINKQSTVKSFPFNSHLQLICPKIEVCYGFQLFRRADLSVLFIAEIDETCVTCAHTLSCMCIFLVAAVAVWILEFICHWLLSTDKTNRDIKKADKTHLTREKTLKILATNRHTIKQTGQFRHMHHMHA